MDIYDCKDDTKIQYIINLKALMASLNKQNV